MDNYKFSTLEYKRPDLEARRTKLGEWKAAVEQAEDYAALRALLFEMDRINCELFTQYAIHWIPAMRFTKRRSSICRIRCPHSAVWKWS